MLVVPATVAPAAGAVIETAGAVVSLSTVTLTGAEVVELPAASRATAVIACAPFEDEAVFQASWYGADVTSLPMFAPSTLNCTPATPMLSEADAVTVVAPDSVAPAAGAVTDTLGAVVSGVVFARTSQMNRLKRSVVGDVSFMVTLLSVGIGALVRCVQ